MKSVKFVSCVDCGKRVRLDEIVLFSDSSKRCHDCAEQESNRHEEIRLLSGVLNIKLFELYSHGVTSMHMDFEDLLLHCITSEGLNLSRNLIRGIMQLEINHSMSYAGITIARVQ